MPKQFCITTDEMENFMINRNVFLKTLKVYYCNDSISTANLCLSEDLSTLKSNCVKILGDIEITWYEAKYVHKLSNVKWIFGTLEFESTDLVSIDFLNNLEYIASLGNYRENQGYQEAIVVTNNQNLTKFDIPNLKNVRSPSSVWMYFRMNPPALNKYLIEETSICNPYKDNFTASKLTQFEMQIHNLSPDFCLETLEMEHFIPNNNLFMSRLPKDYCGEEEMPGGRKTCYLNDSPIKNMDDGCIRVVGDIKIDSGDEEYGYKLKDMKFLFGTLLIFNTNLVTVDFLDDVEYMASLVTWKPLFLLDNYKLLNISLPSLKVSCKTDPFIRMFQRVRASSTEWFRVAGSCRVAGAIEKQPNLCLPYKDVFNETYLYTTSFGGVLCSKSGELLK
uniref:Recep_L_domain domain-containing protein n=1 Tax=Caenorhabditis tropicalis TaxID=1561998 RepID=A0A1I7V1U0_9PELO